MMEERLYREQFLNRSIPFLTENGIDVLKDKTVAVAGCGGVGGCVIAPLVRMGIGGFHLADPGFFDMPDLNRQLAATSKTLNRNKAIVYQELINEINPFASVHIWEEGIQENNIKAFLDEVDILIDCLDLSIPVEFRSTMLREARNRNIFAINPPVLGFGCLVFCSDPNGMSLEPVMQLLKACHAKEFPRSFYKYFEPRHVELIDQWIRKSVVTVPSIAVSTMVSGCAVATETIAVLLGESIPGGRKPITLPSVLAIDFYGLTHRKIQIEDLFEGIPMQRETWV